jgi:hypothetical protein
MHLKRSKNPFMVILYASNMVPSREADVSIGSVDCINGKMHSLFRRRAKFTKFVPLSVLYNISTWA